MTNPLAARLQQIQAVVEILTKIHAISAELGLTRTEAWYLRDVAWLLDQVRAQTICDICRSEGVKTSNKADICGGHYQALGQRLTEEEARVEILEAQVRAQAQEIAALRDALAQSSTDAERHLRAELADLTRAMDDVMRAMDELNQAD